MGDRRSTAGLSGRRFLNLCEQLFAYRGAVRAAAERWRDRIEEERSEPAAVLMLDPDMEVDRG